MTEAELRSEVVKAAHDKGWLVFSLPIARTRRPVKDAVGYPDLTLARLGRVLWIELKQQHENLSDVQWKWFRELGPLCTVVRPSDIETLERLLA